MNPTVNHATITVREDRYGGVVIDDSTILHPLEVFEENLIKIISCHAGKNLMWITLPIGKSSYIPLFTKHGFCFYDCSENSITLFKRLTDNPAIPTATNHTIGVGAFIRDGDCMLVVRDSVYKRYKLPGGYVNNEENISQALEREVFEETGVEAKLESIISIGHFSPGQFNESNLYVICNAIPLTTHIDIADTQEIIEAKWMRIDTYMNSKDVHPYNKRIVKTAMQNRGIKLEVNDFSATKKNCHHEFFF